MTAGVELLEALPVAVYTTDADGRITYYNQAASDLWGHHPELGCSQWCGSWRIYWPDGRPLPHDQCPMAVTLKEGRPVRGVEAVAERPDGTRVPFLPYPTPLRDASGRVIGAINLLVDLTERHRAEAESARLAAIVASSDDAIISMTLDGRITSWNAGATRLFGYEASEMIGQPISRIIPLELNGEEKRLLAQLERGERFDHYETVRVAKDGRRLDISLTLSPLHDKAGTVVGAAKVARDITQRKQGDALQRLLVDELTHRVKNTLATVQSIANQTLRHAASPGDFVASFSGRVLALARAHTLLTKSAWRGTDLAEIVRDELLLGGGDDDRISISGPMLMLDSQVTLHVALVLHELGTNARKHGALSVPNGRLSVRWGLETNEGRRLLLEWKESGGPRVRAPSARGFGSALIEQSLQAYGGAVSTHYGAEGVRCKISLPLRDRMQPASSGAGRQIGDGPSRLEPGINHSGVRGKRILVVEDEPLIAMDVTASLTEAGCEVIGPAANIAQAKRLLEEMNLDAALLDANLGGAPVDELAAALTRQNVPFAFATGYGREAVPRAFREAIMISKPFTHDQLLAVIGELVRQGPDVVRLRQKKA